MSECTYFVIIEDTKLLKLANAYYFQDKKFKTLTTFFLLYHFNDDISVPESVKSLTKVFLANRQYILYIFLNASLLLF